MDDETVPPPLEWHPAYRDKTWLLDWLNGSGPDVIRIPRPAKPAWASPSVEDGPMSTEPTIAPHILTRRMASGPAPYVGPPFIYAWTVGTDELGRHIASESERVYRPPVNGWIPPDLGAAP